MSAFSLFKKQTHLRFLIYSINGAMSLEQFIKVSSQTKADRCLCTYDLVSITMTELYESAYKCGNYAYALQLFLLSLEENLPDSFLHNNKTRLVLTCSVYCFVSLRSKTQHARQKVTKTAIFLVKVNAKWL